MGDYCFSIISLNKSCKSENVIHVFNNETNNKHADAIFVGAENNLKLPRY